MFIVLIKDPEDSREHLSCGFADFEHARSVVVQMLRWSSSRQGPGVYVVPGEAEKARKALESGWQHVIDEAVGAVEPRLTVTSPAGRTYVIRSVSPYDRPSEPTDTSFYRE